MAISNAAEYRIGVKNTKAFIDANPITVQLRRPKAIKNPQTGGVKRLDPELIAEQSFRIVPMSGLVWDRSRTTPDEGRVPDVTEILTCMPDADVREEDWFPGENGGWFKVTHVSPVTGYRIECRLRWSNTEPSHT